MTIANTYAVISHTAHAPNSRTQIMGRFVFYLVYCLFVASFQNGSNIEIKSLIDRQERVSVSADERKVFARR